MNTSAFLAMIPPPQNLKARYSLPDSGVQDNLVVGIVASDDGAGNVTFAAVEINNGALALTPSSGSFQKFIIGG